jgi:CIC family chloride channel protein
MAERATSPQTRFRPLRWLPEFLELSQRRLRRQARMMGLSMVVGIIAGLGAVVFFLACQVVAHYALEVGAGYQPHAPAGERPLFAEVKRDFSPWFLLVVPALGGVVSGLLVFSVAPEAEGHGTDAAIAAYHNFQGYIRPRVPLVKIIASAITLGTGGSGGREGPIAQIGAGFGSFLAGLLRLRSAERRILMAAGMGAGVAAIFRAPLAGALFAAEVLYRSPDFESEVVIPAGLASVTAYCTFGLFFGWESLFVIPKEILEQLTFTDPLRLLPYAGLALFMVLLAMLYTRSFYGLTHLFHRLPLKPHFKPAIGAFLSAVIGVALYFALQQNQQVLAVLSFGYGILQDAMTLDPEHGPTLFLALVLLAVAIGKILTTGLTIGSGGSGGVFGPSMVIGGCGGGALGIVLHKLWPGLVPYPQTFVIVGMAGFFAAAAKTPFSTLVIVSEMTGGYSLLLPTLWVCTLSFLLSDEQSIYSSQVESRSRSPAHRGDYVREVLTGLQVGQFLTPLTEVPPLRPEDSLEDVLIRLGGGSFQTLPVADAEGHYLGVVNLEDVHLASQFPNLGVLVVAADLMQTDVTPLRREQTLDRALEVFVENDLLALPVVDDDARPRVLGMVRRVDVSATYLRHVHGKRSGEIPLPPL